MTSVSNKTKIYNRNGWLLVNWVTSIQNIMYELYVHYKLFSYWMESHNFEMTKVKVSKICRLLIPNNLEKFEKDWSRHSGRLVHTQHVYNRLFFTGSCPITLDREKWKLKTIYIDHHYKDSGKAELVWELITDRQHNTIQ